jgi:ATP-dependent metalloprotease FtsH
VFIDEIDGVGRRRGRTSGHNEEGKTLNQLLTEMDGFEQTSGIVVIGATNFGTSLDPALVRPGRFNKKIKVPLPDVRGRRDILEMYLKRTKVSADIKPEELARMTTGWTGADLENLVNTAATKAAIRNIPAVTRRLVEESLDDIRMGVRNGRIPSKDELTATAFHEGGHALVAMLTEGAMPLQKCTIVSRGHALGVTVSAPDEDKSNSTREELLAQIAVALGGRAAEEVVYGADKVSTGASSDLKAATTTARAMVAKCGMGDRTGLVYHDPDTASEAATQAIDGEVQDILQRQYQYAVRTLEQNKGALYKVVDGLLRYETLTAADIRQVLEKGEVPRKEVL